MLHKLTSLLLVLAILLAGSLQRESILLVNTTLESRSFAKLKATASARKSPKSVPGWVKFWDDCDVFIRAALATKMCFVEGTQVMVSHDGIETCLVPIEEIYPLAISNPDFRIWSKDEFSGEEGWKRPVTFFRTHPVELYHLQIDLDSEGGHDEVIAGTGPHPFWIEREKKFVPLEELEAGDILTLSTSESAVVVSNIRERAPPEQVFTTYNFEVEDFHTFFVGESQVWLHNLGRVCEEAFATWHRLFEKHDDIAVSYQQLARIQVRKKVNQGARSDTVEGLIDFDAGEIRKLKDSGDLDQRLVDLGTNPTKGFVAAEAFTASRFELISGKRLVSREPVLTGPDGNNLRGADFKDANGDIWDAVGPLPSSAFDQPNRLNGFFNSIVANHVDVPEKGNIIVDLAGLPPSLKERALSVMSGRLSGGATARVNVELSVDNGKTIIFLDD